ncbi:MAG: NAD+ synthase, partial [Hyphomicrobium sp.]
RTLAAQLPAWREAIVVTEWTKTNGRWVCAPAVTETIEAGDGAAYAACVLGLRDYVSKNGFPGVVLGLSGGIDSALVAAIAVDALGPSRVHAIMLPSRHTSDDSLTDAATCAKALGIRYDKISIEPGVAGLTWGLKDLFAASMALPIHDAPEKGAPIGAQPPDTTEENIQSRVRGTLLMAVSNKFGAMVVTTGNKSEMSVGYATLYGDMNGGFNPIKDLYKMEVYRLSRWRNEHTLSGGLGPRGVVIPERILTKAPTAELRPDQTDQDSLPPYEVLDDILACLVEGEMPLADIVAKGHAPETVLKIERLLRLAEYKRRQAAPGVKISSKSFGRERRYPITNKFREEITAVEAAWPAKAGARIAVPRADGGDE